MKFNLQTDFVVCKVSLDESSLKPSYSELSQEKLLLYVLNDTFPHQGLLTKKDIFNRYGTYDESLLYAADWSFIFKSCILYDASFELKDLILAKYDTTGLSSVNQDTVIIERQKVINSIFSSTMQKSLKDYNQMANIINLFQNKYLNFVFRSILFLLNKRG